MPAASVLEEQLTPGRVYRREDLKAFSTAIDRELSRLVRSGKLRKASRGVYFVPRTSVFGAAPPEDRELVCRFLRDDHFLLTSPNAYNSLGVGTTQLYNEPVVYNHKRHGRFKLGNRTYHFKMKPRFPKELSAEFLLVDLVNNLQQLAEDKESVLERVLEKARQMDPEGLAEAANEYGGVRARKLFAQLPA